MIRTTAPFMLNIPTTVFSDLPFHLKAYDIYYHIAAAMGVVERS
jgi:hypothetical protein